MYDDLAQLQTLWELALGFERSLADNAHQAKQFSLLAAPWCWFYRSSSGRRNSCGVSNSSPG